MSSESEQQWSPGVSLPTSAPDRGRTVGVRSGGEGSSTRTVDAVDHAEESPDLLRWRADLLLDEMMLGGVDVSAAANGAGEYTAAPRTRQDSPPATNGGSRTESARREMPAPAPQARPPMPSSMPASLTNAYPDLDAPSSKPWDDGSGSVTPRPLPPVVSGAEPASSGDVTRSERLVGLEERYSQYRREQEATIQPAPPKQAPTMNHDDGTRPTPSRPVVPEDETTQWAESPEKWLRQDFSPTPEPPVEPPPVAVDPRGMFDRVDFGDAAVRQDPAHFVNAMSVMSNKKRSNLLPRMSTLNADELNREIATLHGEIAELLPEGQESGERARHLLEKAHSILNSDPMRSAEVEYYMQQVRTIVQRRRQARAWSDLYRSKLRVYLTGWLGLSLMALLARYVFQAQVEAVAMWAVGATADGLLLRHWAAFIGAGAAGAAGGAAGAIYTMLRADPSAPVLFDRKYGLRGLMLPIIGLLVGLVAYPLFGAVFGVVGWNPAANIVAGTVPALAAFAFGFSQESVYGTRS